MEIKLDQVVVKSTPLSRALASHPAPCPPCILFESEPNSEKKTLFTRAYQIETEIQNVPELACKQTNTYKSVPQHSGVVHIEGGWPAHVEPTDTEERIKYAKRQQKENYLQSVAALITRMNEFLKINAALDIYQVNFSDHDVLQSDTAPKRSGEEDALDDIDPTAVDPASSAGKPSEWVPYSDPESKFRLCTVSKLGPLPPVALPVRGVAWTCGSDTSSFAVGYGGSDIESLSLTSGPLVSPPVFAALWDARNPAKPKAILEDPFGGHSTAVTTSPKDAHIVVTGTNRGRVRFWDCRTVSKKPTGASPLEEGHKGAVTGVKCLVTKGLEFFSAGTDGSLLFWDARNLTKPVDAIAITAGSQSSSLHSLRCVDYDPQLAGSNRILLGTDEGTIAAVTKSNRGGVNNPASTERVLSRVQAHYGPVCDISRHPSVAKIYASGGDWGFKIFSDDLKVPINVGPFGSAYTTSVRWHPIRAGVLFAGDSSGQLTCWDFLHSRRHPAMALNISSSPVHCIAPHIAGKILLVGSADGAVQLVRLPASLAQSADRAERTQMTALFEQDTSRERAALISREGVAPGARQGRRVAELLKPEDIESDNNSCSLGTALDAVAKKYLAAVSSGREEPADSQQM